MSNDMTMDELLEVLARYRYNAKHDGDRIKALEGELSRVRAELTDFKSTADRFKAEVERWEFIHRMDTLAIQKQKEQNDWLRKAGDAMVQRIRWFEKPYKSDAKCPEIEDWNAAKDGKPTE